MDNCQPDYIWVYITAPNREVAHTIGRGIVEGRFAACTNLLPNMTSYYWWEGSVETAEEWVIIAKTLRDRLEELGRYVQETHPYKVPCVMALPITHGSRDYMAWLQAECQQPSV